MNELEHMNASFVIPVIAAFIISAALCPVMIPVLRKMKVGNTEREELESHQKKMGTPTMGGIMILLSITVTSLFFIRSNPGIIPILFVTLGFGIIGFLDDYLKVVLRRSDGLLAWQKMLLEIVVYAVFAFYITHYTDVSLAMIIPFTGGKVWDIGMLAIPLMFFVLLGTVNGVNFTDGLDGLASSVTVLVATFFSVVAIGTKSGIEPITCAVAGALLGFLLFNVHPASVFMGDTGSLALGGFVASTAYMLQLPLFILIVGLIYLIEVISVILQVGYFKLTHGKRIFKMAPIHHHFELGGWSEWKVVFVFWTVGLIGSIMALKLL